MAKTMKKSKKAYKSNDGSSRKNEESAMVAADDAVDVEMFSEQDESPEVEDVSDSTEEIQAPARRRRSMNGDITYIALDTLLAVVEEVGLKAEEKKAWLKVGGQGRARVYLPRRKTVGRVDIADFEAPAGTSVKLGERSFGAVKEQLDMAGPEEHVLENFRTVLRHLASLPAEEPKARRRGKAQKDEGEQAVA